MVPGPMAWAQGPRQGPRAQGLFLNHSSSWGELFCVGFLLHNRVLNFGANCSVLGFCCIIGCWTSG